MFKSKMVLPSPKKMAIIVGAIVLVILIVGAVVYFRSLSGKNEQAQENQTMVEEAIPQENAEAVVSQGEQPTPEASNEADPGATMVTVQKSAPMSIKEGFFILPDTFFGTFGDLLLYRRIILWVFFGFVILYLFYKEREVAEEVGDVRIVCYIIAIFLAILLFPSLSKVIDEFSQTVFGLPIEFTSSLPILLGGIAAFAISVHGKSDFSPLYVTLFVMGMVDIMMDFPAQGNVLLVMGICIGILEMIRSQAEKDSGWIVILFCLLVGSVIFFGIRHVLINVVFVDFSWLGMYSSIAHWIPAVAEEASFIIAVTTTYLIVLGIFAMSRVNTPFPGVEHVAKISASTRQFDLPLTLIMVCLKLWISF